MRIVFTDDLDRREVVEVLMFISAHPEVKKVSSPGGRLIGVEASEQRLAELWAEVPRLSVLWQPA